MINGNHQNPNNEPFTLGDWQILPALNRIEANDKTIQLEPRAMMVLIFLASKPGTVFSRSEIMENVWTDSIVNDEALTRIISILRHSFDDNPKKPRFIETIYKRGYRLVAIPEKLEIPKATSLPGQKLSKPKSSPWLQITLPAIFALILVIVLAQHFQKAQPDKINSWDQAWKQTPLTSFPGYEFSPVISPDGSRVAFIMQEPQSAFPQLWIKTIDSDSTFTLSTKPGFLNYLTWAPDGDKIAYVNHDEDQSIRVISINDGTDHELFLSDSPVRGMDWAPDGEKLAICMAKSDSGRGRIFLVNLADNSIHLLTSAPEGVGSDFFPTISPDGRQLAFCRIHRNSFLRIHILSLTNGEIEVMEPIFGRISGLDWAPDGQHLLVATYPEEIGLLQVLDLTTGLLQDVKTQTSNLEWISCAQTRERMVFADFHDDIEIQSLDISVPGNLSFDSVDFNSTKRDLNPVFSPDGRQMAFISLRTGYSEIMVKNSAEEAPHRLTNLQTQNLTNLIWAPDGKSLATTDISPDCTKVIVVDLNGNSSVITSECCRDFATSWSADGNYLFVQSDRSGGEMTWRIRPDGTDAEVVLPHAGVVLGERPLNGNLVFFQRRKKGIWERNIADESEYLVLEPLACEGWQFRHLKNERIFFANNTEYSTILGYYDLHTSTSHEFVELPVMGIMGFTLSPDDHTLLIAVHNSTGSDLVLLERPKVPKK